MNHCKLKAGHQPSRGQKSKSGALECFTCKSEFRSYHNLMEHRKEEQPSHKKCRYYIKGECFFSSEECWYIHDDIISSSEPEVIHNFEYYVCKNMFSSKYDLLEHKKQNHPSKVPCKNFQKGTCERSAEKCRFSHVTRIPNSTVTTNAPNSWANPLPYVQKQNFHKRPETTAPDQTALLTTLNMLCQRLETLENRMFPKTN